MTRLIDNVFKDFYYYEIDLSPFFGCRVPKKFLYYAEKLKYSFKAPYKIDGNEVECLFFTDFKDIEKIWHHSLLRLIRTARFVIGIPLQTNQGLIYKGEILVAQTYLRPEDASGKISSLPYRSRKSKKTTMILHPVFYNPSFF
ncbi:MAG: hypothetical protein L3J07_01680 [Candidatus Magasanikbacteria bacterium]|nr:hypothetical protein [Candidatus Magasanikbacteria bacterium]